MVLNEHQQRALALLKRITASTVEKRVRRDLHLLSTTDTGIDYKLFPDQWREWCVGWAFPIVPALAAALDIQLTERVEKCFKEDGKTPLLDDRGKQRTERTLIWTQGSTFNFCVGYTIYDVPEAWTVKWGDALQHLKVALQVKSSIPAEPATVDTPRNAGAVIYDIYRPNAQKTALEFCETRTATQDDFVEILITGLPEE